MTHSGQSEDQYSDLDYKIDAPTHTYRCGGSRGIGADFREHRPADDVDLASPGTCIEPAPHLIPVSPGDVDDAAGHLKRLR